VSPLTLSANTNTSTCPKRPLPLIWDPPVIFYLFLRSLVLPITQVSHSGPLILLSLLLSIILPLFCSQMPSLHFPIILYTKIYITFLLAYHLLQNIISPLPAPPFSIFFSIFRTIYRCFLLLEPLPTFPHHIRLF
jgi:hypothetical protein